jgi:hypothetical protein
MLTTRVFAAPVDKSTTVEAVATAFILTELTVFFPSQCTSSSSLKRGVPELTGLQHLWYTYLVPPPLYIPDLTEFPIKARQIVRLPSGTIF